MKPFQTFLIFSAATVVAVTGEPCYYFNNDPIDGTSEWFQFHEDNPPHWSWNAVNGDGETKVQDDGWAYFDPNMLNNIVIFYKDGRSTLYQPPNNAKGGWCTLQPGGQNNIDYIKGWWS